MTMTTTYALGAPSDYLFSDGTLQNFLPDLELTGLDGGGVAFAADLLGSDTVGVGIGSAAALSAHGVNTATGTVAHIAQIKSGDLAVVSQTGGDIYWQVFTSIGGDTLMGGQLNVPNSISSDVAAMNSGRFVIADQVHFTGADNDIQLTMIRTTGVQFGDITVDGSLADDENPTVTGMRDGSIVVAWDRVTDTGTQAWFAEYNNDLTLRSGPRMTDGVGSDDDSLTSVALAKGGFALAYVDNGDSDGVDHITVASHKSNGALVHSLDVSSGGGADSDPSMTLLQNGLLAVTWTHDGGLTGSDIYMQLVDPKSGELLLSSPELVTTTADNERDSSVAPLADGDILVSWFDETLGEEGKVLPLHPTFEGDAGKDFIRGAGTSDTINGEGGSDRLRGGVGDDVINGGDGHDVINGQAGFDQLTGGQGRDTFQFSSITDIIQSDTITDLQNADHINLTGIDADTTTAGDQAFTIVSAFTNHAGQMTIAYDQSAGYTVMQMDVDGDGATDGFIVAYGDHTDFHNFAL